MSIKVGVIKIAHHLQKEFEDVDYNNKPFLAYDQHPPNCFHSYAAATDGFALLYQGNNKDNKKMMECDMALVWVDRDIFPAVEICKKLKDAGKVVLLGFHENIHALEHQVANNPQYLFDFQNAAEMSQVDAIIHSTSRQTEMIWNQLAGQIKLNAEYVPICYPEHLAKDYTIDPLSRKGIIIGTRVLNNFLMRNTMISMIVASKLSHELDTPVTFVWREKHGFSDIAEFKQLFPKGKLNLITGDSGNYTGSYMTYPLQYIDWLKLIAQHKICINIDFTMSQGDVPGDCVFVNVPCVGGNSDIQRIAYPNLGFDTSNLDHIYNCCLGLLKDDHYYKARCYGINQILNNELSFKQCKKTLEGIYKKYAE